MLFCCTVGADTCLLPGGGVTFTALAPSPCPGGLNLPVHRPEGCEAGSCWMATKAGLCFFYHIGVVPFQIFFQPSGNHFGWSAGMNELGCGWCHLLGSEELGPQIVPQSPLWPLQMFIKSVSRENTASVSRNSSRTFYLWLLQLQQVPGGSAQASFIKNKKPSWRRLTLCLPDLTGAAGDSEDTSERLSGQSRA